MSAFELPLKGITMHIYRHVPCGDLSNQGMSSRVDTVTLIHPRLPRCTEAIEISPPVILRDSDGSHYAAPIGMDGLGLHGFFVDGGTILSTPRHEFFDLMDQIERPQGYGRTIRLYDRLAIDR